MSTNIKTLKRKHLQANEYVGKSRNAIAHSNTKIVACIVVTMKIQVVDAIFSIRIYRQNLHTKIAIVYPIMHVPGVFNWL